MISIAIVTMLFISLCGAISANLKGVTFAGAEFGVYNTFDGPVPYPGVHEYDYMYPNSPSAYEFFIDTGMNAIRIPFRWERLQPSIASGFINSAEMGRLRSTVNEASCYGAHVILDMHNYGRHNGRIIGESEVTKEHLAEIWRILAIEFMTNNLTIFALMNEPHSQDSEIWVETLNYVISEIRSTRAENIILASGVRFSTAKSWTWSDSFGISNAEAFTALSDPLNETLVEVHQYMDSDGSGTSPICFEAQRVNETLYDITSWLRETGFKAVLGEFGASDSEVCLDMTEEYLQFLDENSDVWKGWIWWASSKDFVDGYFMNLHPAVNGEQVKQLELLRDFLPDQPLSYGQCSEKESLWYENPLILSLVVVASVAVLCVILLLSFLYFRSSQRKKLGVFQPNIHTYTKTAYL